MGSVTRLREDLEDSLSVSTRDSVLYQALADARLQVKGIDRVMRFRNRAGSEAANRNTLSAIRSVADALRAAAHEYETAEKEDRE